MALTLTRKQNETIVVDHPSGPVVIKVDRRVKLAIEAPKDVKVVRGELIERKEAA